MPFIIAEAGVNHLGNFDTALTLINVAKSIGADAVKFQAYRAKDIATPKHHNWNLYKQVELEINHYLDMISYGQAIGIDVFFSVFSSEFEMLRSIGKYNKYAARQFNHKTFKNRDFANCIFSIPETVKDLYKTKYNQILHVSGYMTSNPHLERITQLSEHFRRPVGYSDHTIGVAACELAIQLGAHIIEKHMYLHKPLNIKFRDFEHGLNFKEFEKMIRRIK